MLSWLKKRVTPPLFADEDKTRVGSVLNFILLSGLAVLLLSLLTIFINPPVRQMSLIFWVIGGFILGITFLLLHNGRVRGASWVLTASLWLLLMAAAYFQQSGVMGGAFSLSVLVILLAGLLINWQASFFFVGISLAAGILMVYAHTHGILPKAITTLTPVGVLSSRAILFVGAAILVYVAINSLNFALDQVRQSENRFRILAMNSPDMIYVWDLLNARTLFVNRDTFCGYPLSNRGVRDVIEQACHPDDIPLIWAHWRQSIHSGEVGTAEYRIRHQAGHWEWIQSRQTVLAHEDGHIPTQLLVTITIITASKEAEQAIQELHTQTQQYTAQLEQQVFQRTQELTKTLQRTETLYHVAQSLTNIQNLPHLLQLVVDGAADALPANRILLYMVDIAEERIVRFVRGGRGKHLSEVLPFRLLWQSLNGWVLREREPILSPRNIADPRESETMRQYRRENRAGSIIVVPMYYQEVLLGTLTAVNLPEERDFTPDDVNLILAIANQAAVAIENARLFDALRASETRLRTVVSSAPVVLWALNQANTITFAEGKGLVGMGLTAEQVVGRAIVDIFQEVPPLIEVSERALAGESLMILLEFNKLTWELRCVPLWDEAGQVDGMIGVAIDVTERMQAEADLRQRTAQLEALRQIGLELTAELELDALLHSIISEATRLFHVDVSSLYLYHDQPEQLILVMSQGDIRLPLDTTVERGQGLTGTIWEQGQPLIIDQYQTWENRMIEITSPVQTAVMGVPLRCQGEFLGVLNVGIHGPHHFSEADAELLELFATQAAVAIQNARLHEAVQHHATTLEQHVVERTHQLQEANERLKELDRLKTKLIDDISHELRTPITNLGLYLDLLGQSQPEKRARYIAVLRAQNDRLTSLVEGIIKVSQLYLTESAQMFTAVDLNQVIKQVLQGQQQRATARGLSLTFAPDKTLLPVRGDKQQIAEIITNLVNNALNYTLEGHIYVCTFMTDDKQYSCLQIKDTGIGIADREMEHIFKRFYRGEQVAQLSAPGIGLGLTIVEEIVKLHQGTVHVYSQAGQGATFEVRLPVKAA